MRLNSLKKIKFLCKSKKTTAIGKSLVKNRIKNRKYFSAQYQNFRKHLRWSKTDLSKEIKGMFQKEIFYEFQ